VFSVLAAPVAQACCLLYRAVSQVFNLPNLGMYGPERGGESAPPARQTLPITGEGIFSFSKTDSA